MLAGVSSSQSRAELPFEWLVRTSERNHGACHDTEHTLFSPCSKIRRCIKPVVANPMVIVSYFCQSPVTGMSPVNATTRCGPTNIDLQSAIFMEKQQLWKVYTDLPLGSKKEAFQIPLTIVPRPLLPSLYSPRHQLSKPIALCWIHTGKCHDCGVCRSHDWPHHKSQLLEP